MRNSGVPGVMKAMRSSQECIRNEMQWRVDFRIKESEFTETGGMGFNMMVEEERMGWVA